MKMSLGSKILFIGLLCLTLGFTFGYYSQETSASLQLKISTNDQLYLPGQSMYINLEIINNFNEEVCFRTNFFSGIKLVSEEKCMNCKEVIAR